MLDMLSSQMSCDSILGKRPHQAEAATPTRCESFKFQGLATPDSTPDPKRPRVSLSNVDGDSNKENVPPFIPDVLGPLTPLTSPRLLRRTSTEGRVSSRRNFPRRRASASNLHATPSTALHHLSLETPPPSPPSLLSPLHVRAKALLRPTCNNTTDIAGRQVECNTIRNFILSLLDSAEVDVREPSTLYISGAPGTGKTALVTSVLHSLHERLNEGRIEVFPINCMGLKSIEGISELLVEALGGGEPNMVGRKGKKVKGRHHDIQKLLTERQSKCIVLLDELDHISNPQALTSLFTLARTRRSDLRLIGIANTHTLTSASSSSILSLTSVDGVKTVHFAPYTPEQLLGILNLRLSILPGDESAEEKERVAKFLPSPAVTLLAKKVAAQTGDVRVAFEVLRGAIDLAVNATATDSLESPPPVVTPSHVLAALKACVPAHPANSSTPLSAIGIMSKRHADSEVVIKIRELGLQSRLVLLSMALARKRLDVGLALVLVASSPTKAPLKQALSSNVLATTTRDVGVDATQLHAFYSAILTRSGRSQFTPVSRSEFGDLLGVLETTGLLMLSSAGGGTFKGGKRRALGRTVSANLGMARGRAQEVFFVDGVRMDEVSRGLGISGFDLEQGSKVDIREEEVRLIWQKEIARISREKTIVAPSESGASVE